MIKKTKKLHYTLGSIQLLVAIGAIPAGYGYLSDVSGQAMGTTVELLKNSPLPNFLIPGLFLLLIHGFGNLFCAWLSFRQKKPAAATGLAAGLILSVWIVVQVAWIGLSSFMQPLFLFIGLLETLLAYYILKQQWSPN